jgi:retinoid hydroxylase
MTSLTHVPGSDSYLELPRMLADPIEWLRTRQRAHGNVWKTRLIMPIVVLVGPEQNQRVLITEREKFSHSAFKDIAFGRLFEGSLILKQGAEHKHDRDILTPAVGRLGLEGSCERVQQVWSKTADAVSGRTVDAYTCARDATFEVSAKALIGMPMDDVPKWRPMFEALATGANASTKTRFPLGALDRGLRARERLIAQLSPLIDAARVGEPRGMLGLLAHHKEPDGQPLPTRTIAEHVLLLFWAGYDTTASAGSWVMTKLAENPAWQERLCDEQRRVLGTRDFALTDQDKLVEHGWFLKEIERMCPSVIFFPRRLVDDVVIGDTRLAKGTLVFYSPYLTHRMPDVFERPDEFDPTRWDPARGAAQAPHTALVGFGGGPRICLGKAFALLQLRVMLTTLVRRYRIEFAPGTKVRAQAIPMHRPIGSNVRFTPRSAA